MKTLKLTLTLTPAQIAILTSAMNEKAAKSRRDASKAGAFGAFSALRHKDDMAVYAALIGAKMAAFEGVDQD